MLYNIVIVDSVGIPIDQPLDATGAGVHSHCTWGSFGPGRSFWPGGMAGCCGSWQLSRCGKSTATIWLSINFTCLLKWLSGIRWGDIWSMDNYYDYFTTFFFSFVLPGDIDGEITTTTRPFGSRRRVTSSWKRWREASRWMIPSRLKLDTDQSQGYGFKWLVVVFSRLIMVKSG